MFRMSRSAAPCGEVMMPILCGNGGIAFFRDASNNPSACNRAFNCSNANCRAPAPFGSMNSAEICSSPRSSYTVMRPRTITCNPFSGRNRSSFADERNITTRICALSSFSVKYKWPESGMRRFEISPSTQQSEYSRSMCDRTAETSARTVQMRRSGGRNWNPSWSAVSMRFLPRSSGANFFGHLDRHDPRDASHDLLVLFRLFQVVGGLQSHPYVRRAAKQSRHLQAHHGRQWLAPPQNAVQHLTRYAQSFGRSRHGQADRWQDIFLDNFARMDRRQSVLSLHNIPLVVVLKIDIHSVLARPAESDAVIPAHAQRPAFRTTLQSVKTKACDVQVLRPLRHFQQLQDTHALPDVIGADPACLAGAVDLFKPFMPEAADHFFQCKLDS